MEDNWYLILELEYDPNPVHDETVIARRIEEKRKFWIQNKDRDYKKGPEYRRYLEKFKDGTIAREMGSPIRRKQLIKEACEITYGQIDKFLVRTALNNEITGDQLQRIADLHKTSMDVVRRRVSFLGITIGKTIADSSQTTYQGSL